MSSDTRDHDDMNDDDATRPAEKATVPPPGDLFADEDYGDDEATVMARIPDELIAESQRAEDVGGPNPHAVYGIAGEQPALVLGSAIAEPFDAAARSAVAREVFALRRGLTALRTRDENTVASLVAAASIEAGINVPAPPYAVFAEVSRAVKKEIPRKVRKAIPELCQRIAQGGQDPREWAQIARRSIDRMATIAAGDVSIVLSDVLKTPRADLGKLLNAGGPLVSSVAESDRARRLLGFVLSPSYLELRKTLGMGVR